MLDGSHPALDAALSDVARDGLHMDTSPRSAESLRFERMRNEVCGGQPFLPLTDLLSPRFAEFIPTLCVIEPLIQETRLSVIMTGASLMEILGDMPNNDLLSVTRETERLNSYRRCLEMIARPCAVWERRVADLFSGASADFEITGFPVIDRGRDRRLIAFFVRYAAHAEEIVSHLAGVAEATGGAWIDLGHSVPGESPAGFL